MVSHKGDQEKGGRAQSSLPIDVGATGAVYNSESEDEEEAHFEAGETDNGGFADSGEGVF
jgi:hypothetical protein